MEFENKKCVLVLDGGLPVGLLANTAAILGITLGKHIPETVGTAVHDKSGGSHLGTIQFPVPVLKADSEKIRAIRRQLSQPGFEELIAVDFTDIAQRTNSYEEYRAAMADTEENELAYLGIGLCGDKKLVNKLTGNLPLLR